MGQGEGPDTQVRRRVRDGAQDVLDGLDDLVDEDLAELELLAVAVSSAGAACLLLVDHQMVALGRLLLLRLVVLPQEDEGLREEHERHGERRVLHERLRELDRAVPKREVVLLAHRHADQGVDDVRRVVDRVRPLVQDHDIHPTEEAQHEDHHGDALEDEVGEVSLVQGVAPTEQQPDDHLQNTEKHRQLHLQGVHVQQLIRGPMPSPIQTERVRAGPAAVLDVVDRGELSVAFLVLESGVEQLQAHGEEVVVHEACEGGEEAEAEDEVARAEEHRLRVAQRLGVPHEPQAGEQKQRAMADVAVHHAEDEGEGDNGQERRVRLLIPGDAVGVDHVLEGLGVLVGADVGGRRGPPLATVGVQERALAAGVALPRILEHGLDPPLLLRGVPDVDAQRHALLAAVEDGVDGLLLDAEEAPVLDLRVPPRVRPGGRHEVGGLRAHQRLVGAEGPVLLGQVLPQDGVLLGRLLRGGRPRVEVDAEGGADLDDLVLHGADGALEVDHEHGLLHRRARLGVGHALLDGAELRERVAPGGAPDRTGEADFVGLGHDAGDVAQASLREGVVAEHRRGEIAPARGLAQDLLGGGDDLRLLHRLVPLRGEGHVVLLELHELLVQLLQLTLDGLQLVAAGGGKELVDLVLLDLAAVDPRDLFEHEAEDALALVEALHVLPVGPAHLSGVHVLELDARILAKLVDVAAGVLHGQDEHPIFHCL
mmetsp:Transcript_83668/g.233030  ORF Transcript_83668/g.233030 Transcript_83668/m.233030 type:complete len:710 (-) Transcript_83668:106-2235(-)